MHASYFLNDLRGFVGLILLSVSAVIALTKNTLQPSIGYVYCKLTVLLKVSVNLINYQKVNTLTKRDKRHPLLVNLFPFS